jgi:CheY-like chemotaxis protein
VSTRILIIEDDPTHLELMTYLLSAYGHIVRAAESGNRALDALHCERPDLILCDVQLPDIDGFGIARWLKGHPEFRSIPLVAVTALAMAGDRDRLMAAGFDGYLAKPIDPETFVQQMELFLQNSCR